MSKQEFSRLDVLLRVQSGRLRVADACALMGLHRRQVFRLLRGLKQDGATSLLSKRRGKPSNHRFPPEVRTLALSILRERYVDFGPTFAAEKLAKLHGCSVSRETLRGWMIEDGLWIDRRHRLASPHQPRRRRDCLGELVQIDGSEHAWFEMRGETCTLLAFVDDATSRLMQLRFVASESAFDYFRATRAYLEAHGKPVAFYSDKHNIFRVNAKDAVGGDGITQFARALMELNIDIICANSPQAKGRIERAFATLQDRMVKELRLAGISTIAAANAWLPEFITDYNARFGCQPLNAKDGTRPQRSGPKPPLAGAALRKAVMVIWCVCFCGMQWRAIGLLSDIPFGTLYGLFARWTRLGLWRRLLDRLRRTWRRACGDAPEPSAVVIDSRSCRSAPSCFVRGIDGGKKVHGVKIQIAVEKYGIPLPIDVAPANEHDTKAIIPVLRELADGGFQGPALGDLGYRGKRLAEAGQALGIPVEAIARGRDGQFVPAGICWAEQPKVPRALARGMAVEGVERSFAWLSRYRRLNTIFERSKEHLIAFVAIVFISILSRRLKRLVVEELGA